jgi:uncharacterized protein (UPF0548 family)
MAEVHILSTVDAGGLLVRLRETGRNFDPSDLDAPPRQRHWRVDRYRRELAAEPAGDPVAGGPWSVACEVSASYSFVDPSIVRSLYDSSEPLETRTLLLEVHFWGLRIYVGVRVSAVYDEIRGEGGARERVQGWCYETLEGHFEQGRICYEVSKKLDTGLVEFHIDAVSRRADPGNLLVAAGFLLFGRRKQMEFAHTACDRMAQLVHARLDGKRKTSTQAAEDHIVVRPDPDKETGPQRAARGLRDGA